MPRRTEPPADVVRRLAAIAAPLPEVEEQEAWTGVRWRIRSTTFAHVMVAQPGYESAYRHLTGDDAVRTVLTFRAAGDERGRRAGDRVLPRQRAAAAGAAR